VVCDPACGTGGFLLGARDHIVASTPQLSESQKAFLRSDTFRGVELVEDVARLAAMNLMLHGVFGETDDGLPIARGDSLAMYPDMAVDVVLTNPPFGTKGSITYSKDGKTRRSIEDLTVARPDFWVATANKQLNFVQHVVSLLKPGGRAAMVLPDNVLYEQGAGTAIRRHLLEHYDVHTLLRLPPGLFYAAGVLANVLFFDKSPAKPGTGGLLVYDLRSENRFSLKSNPISADDLEEFIDVFIARRLAPTPPNAALSSPRYRMFDRNEILSSEDCPLDLEWAIRGSETTPALDALDHLSKQISANLEAALEHVRLAGNGSE
jgi:type I restriction enzyme M protein